MLQKCFGNEIVVYADVDNFFGESFGNTKQSTIFDR